MSLKYFAQKLGPAHYVLPRTRTMRVDAHAFFSDMLFERTEESMWNCLAPRVHSCATISYALALDDAFITERV